MLRRCIIPLLVAVAIASPLSHPVAADQTTQLITSADSLPAERAPALISDNASCASACQAKHDQCRVATKGGPDCDAERQRCLQACLTKKSK